MPSATTTCSGARAGHGRQHGDGQLVGAAPPGGGHGARDAGRGRRAGMGRPRLRDHRRPRASCRTRPRGAARPSASSAKGAAEPGRQRVRSRTPRISSSSARRCPALDGKAKTDGSAQFTLDVSLPGHADGADRAAAPLRRHREVRRRDGRPQVQGRDATSSGSVRRRRGGATSFWAARKGREALRVTWDESRAERRGSDDLYAEYRALASRPGKSARRDGDPAAAFGERPRSSRPIYEFPYLAHAPMEPLDAVIRVGPTAARSGPARRSRPSTSTRSRASSACPPARSHQHAARRRQLRPPRHAGRRRRRRGRRRRQGHRRRQARSSSCGRARTTSRAAGIARSTCTACAPGSTPAATSWPGSIASSASRS